jgi:tetratricopeptide (TPR) repeat protein
MSYVLDAAAEHLEGKFKDRPLIEASILRRLSGTYRVLGEAKKAEQHLLDAIRIYEQHYGEDHPITQKVMFPLGWIYEDQGRYHDMERIWTKRLKFRQSVSGVELQPATMNALVATYYYLGKYQEAESIFNRVIQLVGGDMEQLGIRSLRSIRCNIARSYAAQGRYEEAERLFVETIGNTEWPEDYDRFRHLYLSELANMYREQGRYDESERLLNTTLEAQRLKSGDRHLHTLMSTYVLTRLYIDQDRYDEANTLLSESLPIARMRLRKEHPLTLRFVNAYAVLQTKQKLYDQAKTFFNEALKGRQSELGVDHPDTLETKNDLAVLYKKQGDCEKAEPLLLEAVEGRRLKLGDAHPHTLESLNTLIDLYEAWNKPEKANEWQVKLPQTEAVEK